MVSSHRPLGATAAGDLEPEAAPGGPATAADNAFQLFELVREEEDPEADKVGTHRGTSLALLWPCSARSLYIVQ